MCGIIGYVGPRNAVEVGIAGLKRLEYRGYDSAGLAVITPGEGLTVVKARGEIKALAAKLEGRMLPGNTLIAHTRWATHGEPSEANAHPHSDCEGRIAVVHNGIIEDYRELKAWLRDRGHRFQSETDTEVLPHLIEELSTVFSGASLVEVVRQALRRVRGTYGLVVLARDNPQALVAARLASPLVIGIGRGEYFVASDVAALLPYTRDVILLDDGEIALVTPAGHAITTLDAHPVEKNVEVVDWSPEKAERGGWQHFTLKEIMEQPEALRNTLRGRFVLEEGRVRLGGLLDHEHRLRTIEHLTIVACGTAYYAGLAGAYLLEELAGIRTRVELASEFHYRGPVLGRDDAVLAISQSGETLDTLRALREAKSRGALTLGIVNRVGSLIARETDTGVYNHIGSEIGVASTKAFLSQYAILTLLTVLLGRQRAMSTAKGREMLQALAGMPTRVERTLAANAEVERLVERFAWARNFLFLGRKNSYPVALEGALKLKELAPSVHAEGYAGGEMKHGPLALIDPEFPTIAVMPRDSVYEKMCSNVREITSRGGLVIAIATEGDQSIQELADDVIYVPEAPEWLTPLVTVVPLQLFSYRMAVHKGFDPDHPRNLAKSVTVE